MRTTFEPSACTTFTSRLPSSRTTLWPPSVDTVTLTAPSVSSNSIMLAARDLSRRRLLGFVAVTGTISLPFQHAPTTYGRRSSPASKPTTTWLPTSG